MSTFEEVDTDTLLTDFRAAEEWLRDHPHGEGRGMIKDSNRRRRLELLDRGVDPGTVTVAPDTRRYAQKGFVLVDDDDHPGQVVHIGRDTCRVINRYEPKWIRRATDEELARLTVCYWCMEDSGVSGLGSEPLVEPQGDSVRTVSGGGFETNRRRH